MKVIVRCRPALSQEAGQPCSRVEPNEATRTVRIQCGNSGKVFAFDSVASEVATQSDLFENVEPMIDHALDGFHATVFAYGQTGSGKTFTMEGIRYTKDARTAQPRPQLDTPTDQHGILLRTIEAIFERSRARMRQNSNIQYRIAVSYMQLYNERVTDLLNPSISDFRLLKIRWNRNNKFTVDNLFHLECETPDHARELFFMGIKHKVMGSHAMNHQSSRSHCLFTFHITAYDPADRNSAVKSELTLVDLAGSEKLSMLASDPSATLVRESIEINASLLALGKVVTALANASKGRVGVHVPYRDSKLTKLLQHALGGNSMTMMIACISPLDAHADETVSTLTYAGRARNITNDPHVNEDPRSQLIRQLKAEIISLKEQICQLQATCSQKFQPDANSDFKPSSATEEALAEKLMASCTMLQHLIAVNAKLRQAVDEAEKQRNDDERRDVELQAENLKLRERIEVLESIVLVDGKDGDSVDSNAERRVRTPTPPRVEPVCVAEAAPRRSLQLREQVEAQRTTENRSASRARNQQQQQQQLTEYSRRYRNPVAAGNYSEYYGLAKKALRTSTNGRVSETVKEVDALMRKAGPVASSLVPLSLKVGGQYGSLAFGGTQDEVDHLEDRRRRREEKRAMLEAKHRQLQQGFASFDLLSQTRPDDRPASSGKPGSTSEKLFDYLSVSESASVFTADQLQRLRERRNAPPSSADDLRKAKAREVEYQREIASAQSLVSALAKTQPR